MFDTIRVGTFNTKDNKINRKGGIETSGLYVSNADLVSSIIQGNRFDLLGTQELTINYVNELAFRMENYKFYGDYRFGNLLSKMPYNENNNIITNRHVLENKTVKLPWLAKSFPDLMTSVIKMSIMPRIATIVISEDEEHRKVCMINTHLDYQVPSIQIRQLSALKDLIKKYSQDYKVILTGDFNMEIGDSKMDNFISEVSDELKLVDIPYMTWYGKDGSEKRIDYIFVPNSWQVEKAGIISSMNTSDHAIVFADVKQR